MAQEAASQLAFRGPAKFEGSGGPLGDQQTGLTDAPLGLRNEKTLRFAGLLQAADGTRTHDLLHGTQTVGPANDAGNARRRRFLNGSTASADPGEKGPIRANTEPQRGRGSNRRRIFAARNLLGERPRHTAPLPAGVEYTSTVNKHDGRAHATLSELVPLTLGVSEVRGIRRRSSVPAAARIANSARSSARGRGVGCSTSGNRLITRAAVRR
jgi:hypothetical protein